MHTYISLYIKKSEGKWSKLSGIIMLIIWDDERNDVDDERGGKRTPAPAVKEGSGR